MVVSIRRSARKQHESGVDNSTATENNVAKFTSGATNDDHDDDLLSVAQLRAWKSRLEAQARDLEQREDACVLIDRENEHLRGKVSSSAIGSNSSAQEFTSRNSLEDKVDNLTRIVSTLAEELKSIKNDSNGERKLERKEKLFAGRACKAMDANKANSIAAIDPSSGETGKIPENIIVSCALTEKIIIGKEKKEIKIPNKIEGKDPAQNKSAHVSIFKENPAPVREKVPRNCASFSNFDPYGNINVVPVNQKRDEEIKFKKSFKREKVESDSHMGESGDKKKNETKSFTGKAGAAINPMASAKKEINKAEFSNVYYAWVDGGGG